MAFGSINLKPGVNTQLTRTLLGDGWSDSQLIRWMFGQPQKLGGWQRLVNTALVGTCRGMHAWSDLTGNAYLGCGTEQRLEVFSGGTLSDITPIRATSNNTPQFSTTATSSTVNVKDALHGAAAGDWVNILVPVSVGGLIIQGFYLVQTVVDANNYTILAASAATGSVTNGGAVPSFTTTLGSPNITVTLNNHGLANGALWPVQVSTTVGGITISVGSYVVSSVTTNTFVIAPGPNASSGATVSENGGNARIQYLLASGLVSNMALSGYGVGIYGAGIYGASSGGAAISPLRQWFLDNWGQLLICNPTNGAIYVWTPPDVTTPAQIVATAPLYNTASFVIGQAQILVCLGAESGGTQYPNLLRWSNVSDYTDFVPTAVNQAGSFNIPSGSKIVAGLAVGLGALIWTDVDLWSMTYQGLPFVFSFNKIGTNCDAISARSVASTGNVTMWPSDRGFFRYDNGSVQPVACPVWDYFFNNVDFNQAGKITSATNTLFNEIAWYFPDKTDNSIVRYVKYNILQAQYSGDTAAWDIGILTRTAWFDHSPIGNPVGTDQNGYIQQHEIGVDADGLPMTSYVTSGFPALGEGEEFWFSDLFIPDIKALGSNAKMSITFASIDYPGGAETDYGPYSFDGSTEYISIRVRGRQMGFVVTSTDLGSSWRLGEPRFRYRPAGRR